MRPSLTTVLEHCDWVTQPDSHSRPDRMKIGTKSDASSFGFFTGISGHLYRRFYITPGFHFGQFADFPVGFGNGSTVPSDFGEITPVKRWTARFGTAITFKAKDFSGISGSDKPSVKTEETSKTTSPKEKLKDTDTNATNLSPLLSNALARTFLRSKSSESGLEQECSSTADAEVETPARFSTVESLQRKRWQSSPPNHHTSEPLLSRSSGSSPIRINSIGTTCNQPGTECVKLRGDKPVGDYSMYFNSGRFYLVIRNATLDSMQDLISGQLYATRLLRSVARI